MKYIYILYLLFLLVGYNQKSVGQSFCGTYSNVPNVLSSQGSQSFSVSNAYVIRVFIHVMRASNGTGGQTTTEVNTALSTLVSDFQNHNICISLLGKDEIWNDTYYNQSSFTSDGNGDGKFDNFSPNSHANAIDIYLYPNDKLHSGLASNIPGTSLVIGGNAYGSNLASSHVLSHELGHCLGLYHTFHGLCEGGCPEFVDGSNSTSCGDFISDTPADPTRFNMNGSCQWTGGTCGGPTTDLHGDTYTPDLTIIMAYTSPSCMQYFTSGQGDRMRTMLASSPILQNVIVPHDITLNSLTFSLGQTKLYSVINSVTAQSVTAQSGATLTLQAGAYIAMEPGFLSSSGSVMTALIDLQCSTVNTSNSAKEGVLAYDSKELNSDFIVFPNPFQASTNIEYNLDELSTVSIFIVNFNGTKIKELKIQELQNSGNYRLPIELAALPQGIYFCVFESGGMNSQQIIKKTKKLVKQ